MARVAGRYTAALHFGEAHATAVMLIQSHTSCLKGLASDGVEENALSAVGLDLLDSRCGEGVRLDGEALSKERESTPCL